MQLAHFFYSSPKPIPTMLTDDFGDEFVAIPSEACSIHWNEAVECRVINADSWGLLIDIGLRQFE